MKNSKYNEFLAKVLAIGKDCFVKNSIAEKGNSKDYYTYPMFYSGKTRYVDKKNLEIHKKELKQLFHYIPLGKGRF